MQARTVPQLTASPAAPCSFVPGHPAGEDTRRGPAGPSGSHQRFAGGGVCCAGPGPPCGPPCALDPLWPCLGS